jgi:hypothetical protein
MSARQAIIAVLLCSSSLPLEAAPADNNVVTIAVRKVSLPSYMPGLCGVSGVIEKVWDGKAFHSGESIALKVPCSGGASHLTPAQAVTEDHHFTLVAADVLLKSKQGAARLTDSGALVWKATSRSYGTIGAVWGYRVIDGAVIPAMPS